jgi:hypothetical protein
MQTAQSEPVKSRQHEEDGLQNPGCHSVRNTPQHETFPASDEPCSDNNEIATGLNGSFLNRFYHIAPFTKRLRSNAGTLHLDGGLGEQILSLTFDTL